ncbi:LysM peptidoglycan-binding domain-containing protein [Sphingomonas sp. S2-65]|uniref:LysM peptidoglycan-binding domain-containing protein n=1 Tax=Sphingomonas sp. S2-65 TaxID=2903960 RepID=UPI001F2BEA8F|nr:LysM peptidoglycan-binding domain-containing protein [Sphingomonas sp. S2-65]UYY57198.1 LysM peptidoglycan-binding domain-containing protein [Sphingomonas sp. S2-65]
MPADRTYVVRPGDTLSAIARRSGVGMRALAHSNGIQNVNVIHVGQRLILPGVSPSAGASGGATRLAGGKLTLTATDVLNIKKTLQTEWVQSSGVDQAHGIIDTILNRVASGVWGSTVSGVVNAKSQFSDINGPIAWRDKRDSVEDLAVSTVSRRVNQVVDAYLAERAGGRASSVGTHLNYANPNYSDKKNLAWINALDGPVFGHGKSIHRHGTTAGLQRRRPAPFTLVLPTAAAAQQAPAPVSPTRAPGLPPAGLRVNGNTVAAASGVQVKAASVKIGHLAPEMDAVIRAVASAARQLQLPTPVITSGNDSRHGRQSLHYSDRALDFRGNNISIAEGRALRDAVRQSLGNRYDVIFETFNNASNNHLHVEYDPH